MCIAVFILSSLISLILSILFSILICKDLVYKSKLDKIKLEYVIDIWHEMLGPITIIPIIGLALLTAVMLNYSYTQ